MLRRGFDVYLIDWGTPTDADRHLRLEDYVQKMIPTVVRRIAHDAPDGRLSIFGYCMGGLFCLIYAGWSHDPQLRNIVTIASPIDSHQVGIAGKLFQAALASARAEGRRVVPVCPVFALYLKRHPEAHDIIDPSFRRSLGLPPLEPPAT